MTLLWAMASNEMLGQRFTPWFHGVEFRGFPFMQQLAVFFMSISATERPIQTERTDYDEWIWTN